MPTSHVALWSLTQTAAEKYELGERLLKSDFSESGPAGFFFFFVKLEERAKIFNHRKTELFPFFSLFCVNKSKTIG